MMGSPSPARSADNATPAAGTRRQAGDRMADFAQRASHERFTRGDDASRRAHSDKHNKPRAEERFRIKTTLGVALTALILLTPFAINNIFQGRYLLGVGSLIIVLLLAANAWTIRTGHYRPSLTFAGLVPAVILFLGLSFHSQGIVTALWCFPAIPAFYFMLPERQAWLANALLLVMAIPHAWYVTEPSFAFRVSATLLASSIFSAIFVRVISQQQQRLERNEAKRREGMVGVSHELRTPLATITAQVDAMLDGIRPLDRTQLQSLSRSMGHLSELVDDLYQLAQADVGTLICLKAPLEWSAIVSNAVEALRGKMRERKLTLHAAIESDVSVDGDARRLRQVIDNLLENAYRYSAANALITVTLCKNGNVAELTVSDSGPGVPDEVLESLFDRFYRAEESRSRLSGGAGLGLSLVKALTEVHEGRVEALHSPLGGLAIRVLIPLHETQKSTTSDQP